MDLKTFITLANKFGSNRIPFFFLLDFELEKPFICPTEETPKKEILYHINHNKNFDYHEPKPKEIQLKLHPINFPKYKQAFQTIKKRIEQGETYLINLTFPTEIKTNATLEEIFLFSRAKFKLYYSKKIVIFSPERFITIRNNTIKSYPMKGTINLSLYKGAKDKLLRDRKEIAEHFTVVDLIRNDLSMVSSQVKVTKFMYPEEIRTNRNMLLQTSSEITGVVESNWRNKIGNILVTLLPAGSISGAPKKRTVEIIKEVEKQKRGYFTGVFGIFDGFSLDSAVCIRFIEKKNNKLFFRSGGGITFLSDPYREYKELLDKIYVPTF